MFQHPVLHFLHQDRFIVQQVDFQTRVRAGVRYVSDRHQHPNVILAVIKNLRVNDQGSRFLVWRFEVDFIGLDSGAARSRRFQQRGQFGHRPFAVPQRAKLLARNRHCAKAEFVLIQQRHIALDDRKILQPFQTPRSGQGSQPRRIGQILR